MADIRTERLAELLVRYCTEVKPNHWVLIRSNVVALPAKAASI